VRQCIPSALSGSGGFGFSVIKTDGSVVRRVQLKGTQRIHDIEWTGTADQVVLLTSTDDGRSSVNSATFRRAQPAADLLKIFGAGGLRSGADEALRHALFQDVLDCFTTGCETPDEFDRSHEARSHRERTRLVARDRHRGGAC
jgi:hypothetical protein